MGQNHIQIGAFEVRGARNILMAAKAVQKAIIIKRSSPNWLWCHVGSMTVVFPHKNRKEVKRCQK